MVEVPATAALPEFGGSAIAAAIAQSPSGSIPSTGNGMSTVPPAKTLACAMGGVCGAALSPAGTTVIDRLAEARLPAVFVTVYWVRRVFPLATGPETGAMYRSESVVANSRP